MKYRRYLFYQKIIYILISLLLLVGNIGVGFLIYKVYTEDTQNNLITNNALPSSNNIIYMEEGLPVEDIEYMELGLNKAEVLTNAFIEDNGLIFYKKEIVKGEDKIKNITAGRFTGLINNPFIEIKEEIYYKERLPYTLIHELGHYLDFKMDSVSNSNYFISLYEKYKDIKLPNDYNYKYMCQDVSEFFAERVVSYICFPEELKTNQPEIYECINTCINSI